MKDYNVALTLMRMGEMDMMLSILPEAKDIIEELQKAKSEIKRQRHQIEHMEIGDA